MNLATTTWRCMTGHRLAPAMGNPFPLPRLHLLLLRLLRLSSAGQRAPACLLWSLSASPIWKEERWWLAQHFGFDAALQFATARLALSAQISTFFSGENALRAWGNLRAAGWNTVVQVYCQRRAPLHAWARLLLGRPVVIQLEACCRFPQHLFLAADVWLPSGPWVSLHPAPGLPGTWGIIQRHKRLLRWRHFHLQPQ